MTGNGNNEVLTLGIDLGGTKVETSLVDTTGHIMASHRHPTQPDKGAEGVIADIIECIKIINAFNPCLLVLGGGVIHSLPEYVSMAERVVRLNALEVALEDLQIIPAVPGNKAGVIGTAALARHKFQSIEQKQGGEDEHVNI